MEDNIGGAIRTMFLRRKLRAIEARRIKYPATDDGRRRFIQDSLKSDDKKTGSNFKPFLTKFIYLFIGLIGLSGLFAVLIWIIKNECITTTGMLFVYLLGCLSMVFIAIGVHGLSEISGRAKE